MNGVVEPVDVILLRNLEARIAASEIDQVWIFPTRRVGGRVSAVAVVAAFDDAPDRRRILTARMSLRTDSPKQDPDAFSAWENGIVPESRVDAVVDGVVRRLADDDIAAPPAFATIAGNPARWAEFLARLRGDRES